VREVVRSAVEDIDELEAAGRWAEAAEYWERVVADQPDIRSVTRCGRALAKAKRPEAAKKMLGEALRLDPDFPAATFQFGLLLTEEHRLEEAASYFERGLARAEVQPILTVLGATQRSLGRAAEATRSLRRALELDPEDSEAHFHLAMVLRESDRSEAVRLLRRAVELDPSTASAHRELGLLLWATGTGQDSLAEAEFHLRYALRLNDEDAWAHHHLGLVLRYKGQLSIAERHLRRAAELMPSNELVFSDLGGLLNTVGQLDAAKSAFQHALSLSPQSPIVLREYGLFERAHGNHSAAHDLLERAVRLDPDDRRAREALAAIEREGVN